MRRASWSWRWDSNPRPAAYKAAALPTELRQRIPRSFGSGHPARGTPVPGVGAGSCTRRSQGLSRQDLASAFAALTRRFIERDGRRGRRVQAAHLAPAWGCGRRGRSSSGRAAGSPAPPHPRTRAIGPRRSTEESSRSPSGTAATVQMPDLSKLLDAADQVRDPGDGHVLDRPRRRLGRRRGHPGGPVPRHHHAVGPQRVGRPDDGAEVVRVLHAVEQDEQRRAARTPPAAARISSSSRYR